MALDMYYMVFVNYVCYIKQVDGLVFLWIVSVS